VNLNNLKNLYTLSISECKYFQSINLNSCKNLNIFSIQNCPKYDFISFFENNFNFFKNENVSFIIKDFDLNNITQVFLIDFFKSNFNFYKKFQFINCGVFKESIRV
jgi:hypothetical protein